MTLRLLSVLPVIGILTVSLLVSCGAEDKPAPKSKKKVLFDGKTLEGWKKIEFGGSGEIFVEDGQIVLGMGEILTGIKLDGEPPFKTNYEITLEAQRIDGTDFFCALTFPIGDSHATYVVGGWGGFLVGISSIDSMDASENETGSVQKLDDKKWYKLRLKVTDTLLQAWIDDRRVVNLLHKGRKLEMRPGEIEECVPFGIATFQTKAALRNIEVKPVAATEEE